MDREYLTVNEVAKNIGISDKLIYKLINKNEFPHIKIGGRILIHEPTLNNWLSKKINHSIN